MPIYVYSCENCGQTFEEYKTVTERFKARCSYCLSGNVQKLISPGINGQINSTYRDVRGERIWFPKDGRPYFDKALGKTFHSPKEKQQYMKENNLAMDGSTSKPISKLPPEAGDMRNRDYRKKYRLDD